MSKITVVLIEDHDLTRIGLKTVLQANENIQVVGDAANATQGLQLLQNHHPDVAMVDIGLPDMDGIELTRRFRQWQTQSENFATKILILTMHDGQDSVLAAFAAGADSYCMKDIQVSQLVEAIQSTASGQSWIDPAIASVILGQVRRDASVDSPISRGKTVEISAIGSGYEPYLSNMPLTARELEILELIVAGCSNADISQRLYITIGTVKTHVRNILNKLSADDRTQAAVRALRSGLVT
ncbi:response regulator transcription factor [Nostoc sp. HG1]|nr:response regulator transcription factor [Nostoc sp. HG1]